MSNFKFIFKIKLSNLNNKYVLRLQSKKEVMIFFYPYCLKSKILSVIIALQEKKI